MTPLPPHMPIRSVQAAEAETTLSDPILTLQPLNLGQTLSINRLVRQIQTYATILCTFALE